MSKIFFLILVLMLLGSFQKSHGVTILDSPPEDSKKTNEIKPKNEVFNSSQSNTKQKNVELNRSNFNEYDSLAFILNSVIQNDGNGSQVFSILDLNSRKDLDDYSIRAEGQIRLKKAFSNNDSLSIPVELRIAKISYLESWLQFGIGRMDLSGVLSPTSFFGCYPTMGIRRLDGVGAVLPIRLAFGGENIKGVTVPPTSISAYYFPALFSTPYVNWDGHQAYLLGQARLRVTTDDVQTNFRVNFGGSGTDYFNYSTVNGNTSFSFCIDSQFSKQYTLYGEYGVQNLSLINGTGALVLGAKAEKIGTWGSFSLDTADVEIQIPVGQDPSNAFTGGNTFFPRFALLPQIAWYGSLKLRLKSVFLQGSFTNSLGDYTFARLSTWPSNLAPVNIPLPVPYGPSNEVEGIRVPLLSSSYSNVAFLVNLGVEF